MQTGLEQFPNLARWFSPQDAQDIQSQDDKVLWQTCLLLQNKTKEHVSRWLSCFETFTQGGKGCNAFLAFEKSCKNIGVNTSELWLEIASTCLDYEQGERLFGLISNLATITRDNNLNLIGAWVAHSIGEARECLVACAQAQDVNPFFLTLEGKSFIELGQFEDARRCLELAVKLAPEEPLIAQTMAALVLKNPQATAFDIENAWLNLIDHHETLKTSSEYVFQAMDLAIGSGREAAFLWITENADYSGMAEESGFHDRMKHILRKLKRLAWEEATTSLINKLIKDFRD